MSINRTSVIAGVAAAFVAAGLLMTRQAPTDAAPIHERGPFRVFTQYTASGQYEAGSAPEIGMDKKTAAVFCFPRHPVVHFPGKLVELDVAANTASLMVRGTDGKAQRQPVAAELGADIQDACTAIRRDGDASGAVNRMAKRLGL